MSPVASIYYSTHWVGLFFRLKESENQSALLKVLIFIYFSPLSRKITHGILPSRWKYLKELESVGLWSCQLFFSFPWGSSTSQFHGCCDQDCLQASHPWTAFPRLQGWDFRRVSSPTCPFTKRASKKLSLIILKTARILCTLLCCPFGSNCSG